MKSFWQGALIIVACISILALTHVYVFITTPTTPGRPVMIEIEPGTSAWEISLELKDQGIVTDPCMLPGSGPGYEESKAPPGRHLCF